MMTVTVLRVRTLMRRIACVLGAFPISSRAAETEAGLKAALCPAPQELSLRGAAQPLGEGKLVLRCGFDPAATAWDPMAALGPEMAGRKIERRRMAFLAGDNNWSAALVQEPAAIERLPSPDAVLIAHGKEAYRLETFPGQPGVCAIVTGGGPRGLQYGLQTLGQLLARSPGAVPRVMITDWPDIGGVRELHVHGFDKGYGAGDFKSLAAFTRDLPAILPHVSAARYNLFRLGLDAAWVNSADRWLPGQNVDAVMRQVGDECRRHGVDLLIEVRFEGQRAGSAEPDTYALNPLTEWGYYEKALRRALGWRPDVIDFSLNDLQAINYPDVRARYGGDGRYSGTLMAELLQKTKAVIDEVKPDTRLHHLPRFYGAVHWQAHPKAMPDLWSQAPKGVRMYITSNFAHPIAAEMRRQYGAQFILWTNYTSNHAKELKVMLTAAPPGQAAADAPSIANVIALLPPEQRSVLINLGYPIAPQHAVALATGERLWNHGQYEMWRSLEKGARRVWGQPAAGLFMQYARLLDSDMIVATRGVIVADLLLGRRKLAADEAGAGESPPAAAGMPAWREYRQRAEKAAGVAQALGSAVSDRELKAVADVLYWNARRIELDARAGELVVAGRAAGRIDAAAIGELLVQHERIIRDHYPVEPNDPKSAEVVMRGIRRIREELRKAGPPDTVKRPPR